MNARSRYILSCLTVGILAMVFVALLGFWGRWICTDALGDLTRGRYGGSSVSPLGFLPDEIENAPNVVVHSSVVLRPSPRTAAPWGLGLGALDYFYGLNPVSGRSDVLVWQPRADGTWMYFDRERGLVVLSEVLKPSANTGRRRTERIWLYAGPEGMAETPDESLGRFRLPVLAPENIYLYDVGQARFFKLDFWERSVVKGPEINPAEGHKPIQLCSIARREELFGWNIEAPARKKDPNEPNVPPSRFGHAFRAGPDNVEVVPAVPLMTSFWSSPYVFVLDASGQIDLLDKETLELAGRAGTLPAMDESFGSDRRRMVQSQALFAYSTQPVLRVTGDKMSKWPYLGCVVGAYNRDGTAIGLATFDKEGSLGDSSMNRTVVYEDVAGGPMVATIRFLLENLHPTALLLLSHFTAPYTGAGAGYRSLFIVPDSFVAKSGRDLDQVFALRLIAAFTLMAPAIVLAVILAVLVARDTRVVGFSKDGRTLWVLVTIAFGLPAYITYRLTRPGATLVTCANCGLPRRPDMDRCHRCNALWEVRELQPPTWRVRDGGRTDFEEPPMATEEPAVE